MSICSVKTSSESKQPRLEPTEPDSQGRDGMQQSQTRKGKSNPIEPVKLTSEIYNKASLVVVGGAHLKQKISVPSHPSQLCLHGESRNPSEQTHLANLPNKKSKRMNSTNDSNFTEQPYYSHQLAPSKLEATISSYTSVGNKNIIQVQIQPGSFRHTSNYSSILMNGLERTGVPQQLNTSTSQSNSPTKNVLDARPFILMKNKGEENSRQFKHGIAQQIINASIHAKGINSAKHRKSSQMQAVQVQLPSVHRQPFQLFSDLTSPQRQMQERDNNHEMKLFYQLIAAEQHLSSADSETHLPQASSQLQKTTPIGTDDYLLASKASFHKHNSMEKLESNKAAVLNNINIVVQDGGQSLNESKNGINPTVTLQYRAIGDKRSSQPPLHRGEDQTTVESQRQLLKRQVEHIKRNSMAQIEHQGKDTNKTLERATIYTHEVTVEQPFSQRDQSNYESFLTPENADWIRKAIEACKQKQNEPLFFDQMENGGATPLKNKKALPIGSVIIQSPSSAKKSPSGSPAQELDSGRNLDFLDSNVKRARILLEKKKKIFEQSKDGRWRLTCQLDDSSQGATNTSNYNTFKHHETSMHNQLNNAGFIVGSGTMNNGTDAKIQQAQQNSLVCIPNITYKSILPAQTNQQLQQTKIRGSIGEAPHPLSSQQLLNGYSKNFAASNKITRPDRKGYLKGDLSENQGIQGKNISIMQANKAAMASLQKQEVLFTQVKMANTQGGYTLQDVLENTDPAFMDALQEKLEPQDYKALQALQLQFQNAKLCQQLIGQNSRKNLLQAMHVAETGGLPLSQLGKSPLKDKKESAVSAFFQFGVPEGSQNQKNIIFFNHNGQTYVRNNETNKFYTAGTQKNFETQQVEHLNTPMQTEAKSPAHLRTNASYQADQMVQLSFGQRSLSKILQGAQLEATLQQILKQQQMGRFETESMTNEELAQYIIQQQLQLQSPQTQMKIRGKSEKIGSKDTLSQKAGPFKPGESIASLSTKPATGATTNSSKIKEEETKEKTTAKKGKKTKQDTTKRRVHIYHEAVDHLKNHKINKAINTINNIIRLIFKNNKDSLAITSTNNTSTLNNVPANRLMDEQRIGELQKIAKQININIPKKFDSKSSLREFFYSREFILTVKIKMQNLLHRAILSANGIPQSVVDANMYGKSAVSQGQNPGDDKNVYQAKKFHVGPGNNFPIVKSVLKQRYWWQYASEEKFDADCDFIWTAWKKQKHIDFLANANNKQQIKASKIEAAAQQQNEGDYPHLMHEETEQRINTSETKLPQKKKREHMGSQQKEKDKEQEKEEKVLNINKIVLPLRLYNKLEQNKQLTNKKGVFVNMRKYYESLGQDAFKVLPLTFHTQHGVNDPDYHKFVNYYNRVEDRVKGADKQIKQAIKQYYESKNRTPKQKKAADEQYDSGEEHDSDDEEAIEKIKKKYRAPQNTWIIKPGENTNRGQGITVVKTIREVQSIIGRPTKKDGDRTFIIQKYIDFPLLVHKRKFDFRCYGLLTSINGSLKGYCYQDGYIRTSCKEYNLEDVTDLFVHLTNDAIQNKSEDYGKFENGNKLSWQDFTKVICAQQPDLDFDFHRDIFPQIQKLIGDTFKASFTKIDPQRLQNTFELFGYDFMLDEDFRLYLIEVNTNPCLEVCCPLLARIIPEVLDNSFKIVLDPLFPSPDLSHNRKFQLNELPQEVKFQLVFDEDYEGDAIREMYLRGVKGSIREQAEEIESDKENELAEDDDAY